MSVDARYIKMGAAYEYMTIGEAFIVWGIVGLVTATVVVVPAIIIGKAISWLTKRT